MFVPRMTDIDLKYVLVKIGNNRKPVCFVAKRETELILVKKAIISVFSVQLSESESILVQVKSEEWGGLWVDVGKEEQIPDKSVLKAIICQSFAR